MTTGKNNRRANEVKSNKQKWKFDILPLRGSKTKGVRWKLMINVSFFASYITIRKRHNSLEAKFQIFDFYLDIGKYIWS